MANSNSLIPTVHEMLENRRKWRLCWHEPVPAADDSGERTADRIVSMMIYEAIDSQRHQAISIRGKDHGIDDYRLLQDFMTTNYAWCVKNTGDHYVESTNVLQT